MKFRNSFVTNSSSSSFTVSKFDLSINQFEAIKNHLHYAEFYLGWHIDEYDFAWIIEETECALNGSVSMDNFDMRGFMAEIGVDVNKVEFTH